MGDAVFARALEALRRQGALDGTVVVCEGL